VIALTLAEAATAARGRLTDVPDPAARVTGVVVDSRHVAPGSLFVAVSGARHDGHDFAAGAIAAGAVAVLAERPVGVPAIVASDVLAALAALAAEVRSRASATVVAVTGSAGKTSTKDLLADLLPGLGETVAAPGNFNNEIGLPLTLLRVTPSTRYLVLEMGARGIGHIAELSRIARPDVGLVLNVGSAHVGEYADGRAGIARAKGELAEAATSLVVLSTDDPLVAAMAERATAPVVTFGQRGGADVRAENVETDDAGRAGFDLIAGGERAGVRLRLAGAHQVANALAAAAVATSLGLGVPQAARVLSAARPRSRWRMEVTTTGDGMTVVNDAYNASPESMRAALRALVDMSRGRRSWAVLGAMGELGAAADDEHDAVGRLAVRLGIDRLVAVGPDARRIHLGASLEGSWNGESVAVPSLEAAAHLLHDELRPGDVVLVKASRAAGLERLAAAVLDDHPAPKDELAHDQPRDDQPRDDQPRDDQPGHGA
jgi:UDP-N-acetylmuramoyl-tripeptide--D-alanyl-D-alanine ligase